MNYQNSVLDAIGNTPLIRLERIERLYGLKAHLFAKLERCNPTGSIKDRAAKEMILDALEKGKITKDSVLIEPTSGNTGIGLASVAAALGMKLYIFMPSNCSIERVKMMRAFGADIRLTDSKLGMSGAIQAALDLAKTIPGSFIPSQFDNPDNALAHYKTTGPEIYHQLDGKIDLFVAAFGTGGTLTGTSHYLKEKIPALKAIGLEPSASPFVSEGKKGPHKIQGIGAGFKPGVLDLRYVDEILTVTDEEAYEGTRELARKEGLFCGITSGANLMGSIKVAKREDNAGKNIVTVLPDDGERYLSVEGLYE
jgi:cysteine synthase A